MREDTKQAHRDAIDFIDDEAIPEDVEVENFAAASDYIRARKELKEAVVQTEISLQQDAELIKARAKVDFNFYAGLLLDSTVMEMAFPPFYSVDLFHILTTESNDPYKLLRFALGLPRGFVKTTFAKIIACYCVHYKLNTFLLAVGAIDTLAQSIIEDIDGMLSSKQAEQIYGRFTKTTDNAKEKIGTIDGELVILKSKGAGASVRGINVHHKRPDFLLCDDIQTRESALSELENEKLKDWFTGTLLKAMAKRGSNRRAAYLGNMYPGECLLKALKDNPMWVSMVTGAILSDGESLWPELQPVEVLLDEFKHDESLGRGHLWFAEVQNDPLDDRYRLLSGAIPNTFDQIAKTVGDASFLIVDPAGFKKASDDNVIATVKVYDSIPVCTKLQGGNWTPKDTVLNVISEALEIGACLIAIESTGYQGSLLYWVQHFLTELHITHIHVVEVKPLNRTKLSRIRDYIKELLAGDVGIAEQARALFTYYAYQYKLDKQDNRDDYLDAPAYTKQVMTNYGALLKPIEGIKSDLKSLPPVQEVDIGI